MKLALPTSITLLVHRWLSRVRVSECGEPGGTGMPWSRRDWWVLAVASLAFGLVTGLRTRSQPVLLLDARSTNVLFDADCPQVFLMMSRAKTAQDFRTQAHPLFPLVTYPVVRSGMKLGMSPLTAVGMLNGLTAATWLALLYVTIRRLGCSRGAGMILAALGASSASALFFFAIPETYGLSSVSLLVPLFVATGTGRTWYRERLLVAASAASLSITVTNWLSGLLLTGSRVGWRRGIQLTANALAAVAVLTAFQARLFPLSHSFLEKGYAEKFVAMPTLEHGASVFNAFFFHTLVAPRCSVVHFDATPANALTVQTSTPGSATLWGVPAVLLWTAFLIAGTSRLLLDRELVKLRPLLGGLVVAQLLLHLWFGQETFLYSLHFLPLLLLLAACSCRATPRWWVLPLLAMLVGLTLANNLSQGRRVSAHLTRELARLSSLPTAPSR